GILLRLAPDPQDLAPVGAVGGVRDSGDPDGAGYHRLLAGPQPLRPGPAHGEEPAFLPGRAAQRLAQPRPRRWLPRPRTGRAPRGGGRRREGCLPRAVDLRLHPLLLDVVRSEG